MPTDVVMPQMGESIAEGTIVRWLKKVGDRVDSDEPLFEISTDKVDAEIPSPAAGPAPQIRPERGEAVPVTAVVAVTGQAGEAPAAPAPAPPTPPAPTPQGDGAGAQTVRAKSIAAEPPPEPPPPPKPAPAPQP